MLGEPAATQPTRRGDRAPLRRPRGGPATASARCPRNGGAAGPSRDVPRKRTPRRTPPHEATPIRLLAAARLLIRHTRGLELGTFTRARSALNGSPCARATRRPIRAQGTGEKAPEPESPEPESPEPDSTSERSGRSVTRASCACVSAGVSRARARGRSAWRGCVTRAALPGGVGTLPAAVRAVTAPRSPRVRGRPTGGTGARRRRRLPRRASL